MKKRLLFLWSVMLMLTVPWVTYAQGHDDFSSLTTNGSYTTRTTDDGWVAKSAQVASVEGADGVSYTAFVINGHTSNVGDITSPSFNGGIGSLNFKYQYIFNESAVARFRVDILQNSSTLKTYTIENNSMTKNVEFLFSENIDLNEDNLVIYIVNLSPSNVNSNRDRVAIYDISWTGYSAPAAPKYYLNDIKGNMGLTSCEFVDGKFEHILKAGEYGFGIWCDTGDFYGYSAVDTECSTADLSDGEGCTILKLTAKYQLLFSFDEETKKLCVKLGDKQPNIIAYELNGGTIAEGANPTTPTETVILQNPTKEGYAFGGWYDNDGFSGDRVTTVDANTDGTLYAKWKYPIVYDLNGGTIEEGANPETVLEGTVTLKNPTREGYEFGGWYQWGNLITEVDASTEGSISARWYEIKTKTVYFVNTANYAQPYCYVWYDVDPFPNYGDWPGKPMTKTDILVGGEYEVWKYSFTYTKYDGVDDDYYKCIFNNNGSPQTVDLPSNDNLYFFQNFYTTGIKYDGTWYTYDEIMAMRFPKAQLVASDAASYYGWGTNANINGVTYSNGGASVTFETGTALANYYPRYSIYASLGYFYFYRLGNTMRIQSDFTTKEIIFVMRSPSYATSFATALRAAGETAIATENWVIWQGNTTDFTFTNPSNTYIYIQSIELYDKQHYPTVMVKKDGVVYTYNTNRKTYEVAGYDGESNITNLVIADKLTVDEKEYTVDGVINYAFNCQNATTNNANVDCRNLETVTFPASITTWGSNIFNGHSVLSNNSQLKSITLKGKIESTNTVLSGSSSTTRILPIFVNDDDYEWFVENSSYDTTYDYYLFRGGYVRFVAENVTINGIKYQLDKANELYKVVGYDADKLPSNGILSLEDKIAGYPVSQFADNCFAGLGTADEPLTLFVADETVMAEYNALKVDGKFYAGYIDIAAAQIIRNGVIYEYNNKQYSVAGLDVATVPVDDAGLYTLTILSEVGGYKVETINAYAFNGNTGTANNANIACRNIASIIIPEGIKTIGKDAFLYCTALTEIALPQTAQGLGTYMFANCQSLKKVTLPEGIVEIPQYMFQYCYALTDVNIPATVANIGNQAFYNCQALQTITLPQGLDGIGNAAFYRNYLLNNVVLPSSLKQIGSQAFYQNYALTSIVIPASVTSIGSQTFYGCNALESVTFEGKPVFTSSNAFSGVGTSSNPIPLYVPKNDLAEYEMYNYGSYYQFQQGYFNIQRIPVVSPLTKEGVVYTYDYTNEYYTVSGIDEATAVKDADGKLQVTVYGVVNGETVNSVDADALNDNRLSRVTFLSLPTVAPAQTAFAKLEKGQIIVPDDAAKTALGYTAENIVVIAQKAVRGGVIYNFSNDHYVVMGLDDTAEKIWDEYYSYYSYELTILANVDDIPVTVVGEDAFNGASSSFKNYNYEVNYISKLELPDGITTLSNYAFYGLRNVATIEVPASVKSIGQSAFHQIGNYLSSSITRSIVLVGTPDYFHNTAFSGVGTTTSRVKLLVPQDDVDVYKALRTGTYQTIYSGYLDVEANTRTLTLTVSQDKNGTDMGVVTGAGTYDYKKTVEFSATANLGYEFLKWNDESTDLTRTVLLDEDKVFTAEFGYAKFGVHVAVADGMAEMGVVAGDGQEAEYLSEVQISAAANEGYSFVKWADGSTDLVRTVTVNNTDELNTYKAEFVINYYDITVSTSDATMGAAATTATNAAYKSEITVTATRQFGYKFLNWTDAEGKVVSSDEVYTFNLPAKDVVLTAHFDKRDIVLTAKVEDEQMGAIVSGPATYKYGDEITLTVKPQEGYYTHGVWDNTLSKYYLLESLENYAGSNELKITTVGNVEDAWDWVVVFKPIYYDILTETNNADWGVVAGAGAYAYKSKVTLEAQPKVNHHFVAWEDDENATAVREIEVPLNGATYKAQFEPDSTYLTFAVNNAEYGKTTPAGTIRYRYNTEVELLAEPLEAGYSFVDWADGVKTAKRTVLVGTEEVTYTANFKINQYTITAASADEEMGTATGTIVADYKTTVTLTAKSSTGYHFVRWSNGSRDSIAQFKVGASDMTYTAQFEPNSYRINAVSNDNEMGLAIGSGTYAYKSTVNLNVQPRAGYHFVQWEDNSTTGERSIIVPLNGATYTATFEPNIYTITVTTADAEMGSVTGGGEYAYKSDVVLEATPIEGYHFVEWSNGVKTAKQTISVPLDGGEYVATFAPNKYDIKTAVNDQKMGKVTGAGSYDYKSTQKLVAEPLTGYHFVQWEDESTTAEREIIVPLNGATYTATFAPNKYDVVLKVNDDEMGAVTGAGTYDYLSDITIEATAKEGYHFVEWSDKVTDEKREIVVALGGVTLTAKFAPNKYDVKTAVNNRRFGSVSGAGSYDYKSKVTLTATPNTGYHLVAWEDQSTLEAREIVVPLNGATYTATFAPNQYEIKLDVNNAEMGEVTGAGTFDYLSQVTIEAKANTGYQFVKWNDGNTNKKRVVEVGLNGATYTAEFTYLKYAIIGMSNNAKYGEVTGSGSYDYKSQVTLTAEPKYGYHFTQWTDGVTTAQRVVTVEAQNATYTAQFEANDYTLTLNVEGEGEVTGAGTYKYGENVRVKATATKGYEFDSWSDGNKNASRKITMTEDLTLTARFVITTYEITLGVNDETMGTVTGAGTYDYMSEATVTAVANEGYRFLRWSDGSKEATRTFTVKNNISLVAEFVPEGTDVESLLALDVVVYAIDRQIMVRTSEKTNVYIFSADGKLVSEHADTAEVTAEVPQAGLYLVLTGDKTTRIIVR